ncbi:MAG: hypothetical protein NVSMB33_14660 [Ktedonobacteraceae bacterium]
MDIHNQPTEEWHGQNSWVPTPMVGQSIENHATVPLPAPPRLQKKLSRRKLLGIAAATGVGVAATAGARVTVDQLWLHGELNFLSHGPIASSMQIGYLLRHAGFGATPDDINTYRNFSYASAVNRLINYQQVPDDAMENRLQSLNLDFSASRGGTAIANMQRWWLLRMAWTQRPLLEKMTLFWHGMLTSSYHKVGGPKSYGRMMVQNQFFRAHAFDTFDNILLGITSDPAMLVYLDLTKSRKNAPNENYARELMELFTLGVGHYTQQDVYQGAAALTGWHVAGTALQGKYVAQSHNNLTKTYLGKTGNLDYKDIINILTNHPATPWFLCRKLFTFFVYENPGNSDLQPLVDTYVKSGHNIGAVMQTLLLSPQFTSQKAYRARIKSPAELVAGTYRALTVQGNGKGLEYLTAVMGQTLFDPPNVAGWPADKVSALWLNSGTWMTRLNYIDMLLSGNRNPTSNVNNSVDIQGIVKAHAIDTPERFVDFFTATLLDGVVEKDRRAQFITYFTQQNTSKRSAHITLTNGKSYPLNNVRGTLYLILASPEYQLN